LSLERDIQMGLMTFGKEVEYFINEDRIGRYIMDNATLEMSEAAEEIAMADATNVAEIQRLQMKFRVAYSVRKWLGDAMTRGLEARSIIEQEEDETR